MTQYNIIQKEGSARWKVEANGRVTSGGRKGHSTQQAAIKVARRRASSGDALVIHSPGGTIRDRVRVQ